MKKKLGVALLVIFLGGWWLARERREKPPEDLFFLEAVENTIKTESFRASSLDYDSEGKQLAKAEYDLVGSDNWRMLLMTGNQVRTEWIVTPQDTFVLDTSEGGYWRMEGGSGVELTSRIDLRETLKSMLDGIKEGRIEIVEFGSEQCGSNICRRYRVVDHDDFELDRYLWIEKKEQLVYKEQYVLGNGQTSMTTYQNYDEITVKSPPSDKPAPEGADVMMLPGGVKLE